MNIEDLNLNSARDTAALLGAVRRSVPMPTPHVRVSTYAGGTILEPMLGPPLPKCKALPKELRARHPFKVRRATKIPQGFEIPDGGRWRVVEVLKGDCNGATPDGLFDPDDADAEGAPILIPEGCSAYAFWLRSRGGTVTFHHGEPTANGWTLFPFQPDINTYADGGDAYCLLAVVRTGSDKNKWFALDQNVFSNLVTEEREDKSGEPFDGNAAHGTLAPGVPARKHLVFKNAAGDVMNPSKNAVERKGFSGPYRRFCPLHPFQLVNYPTRASSAAERARDWRRVAVASGRVNVPTDVAAINALMSDHYGPHMAIPRNYRLSRGTDLIARKNSAGVINPTHTLGHTALVEENSRRYFWIESALTFYRGSTAPTPVLEIKSGSLEELQAAWPNYPEQPACDLYMGDRGFGRRLDDNEPEPRDEVLLTAGWRPEINGQLKTPKALPAVIGNTTARVMIGWVDVGSDDPAAPDYRKVTIHQNVTTHLTLDAVAGGGCNLDGHPQREFVWSEPGNYLRVAGFYHYERRNFCSVKFSLDNSSATFAAQVYDEDTAAERFTVRYNKRESVPATPENPLGVGDYIEDTARPKRTTWQTPDRFIKDPWGFNAYHEDLDVTHYRHVAPGGAKYYNGDAAWMDQESIEDAEAWQDAIPPRYSPEDYFNNPGYARHRPAAEGGGWVLKDENGDPIRAPEDYDFEQSADVQNGYVESPLDADQAFEYARFLKSEFKYKASGNPPLKDFDGGYIGGAVLAPTQSNYKPRPPVYSENPYCGHVLVNNGEDFFYMVAGQWLVRGDSPHPDGVDIRQRKTGGDLYRVQ